jgi:hypothetical protein
LVVCFVDCLINSRSALAAGKFVMDLLPLC